MTAPAHDPRCGAVQFDPVTGAYTGRKAFDPANCQRCRDTETPHFWCWVCGVVRDPHPAVCGPTCTEEEP